MKFTTGSPQKSAASFRLVAMFWALLTLFASSGAWPNDIRGGRGRFVRSYWHERGIEHGNPYFNSRFRVNAPEASLHPSFMHRSEVRGNGMMQILIEENLSRLISAEFYLELWGGHPETANKRVTINGTTTYRIPEVGTEENNCTHSYPTLPLKITDLVNGYNAIQFACDQGKSFWGHFIVDSACLRAVLKDDHPDLEKGGLADLRADVAVHPMILDRELIPIELKILSSSEEKVSSVEFIGYYRRYDENENGNGKLTDWHGLHIQTLSGRVGRQHPLWRTQVSDDEHILRLRPPQLLGWFDLDILTYCHALTRPQHLALGPQLYLKLAQIVRVGVEPGEVHYVIIKALGDLQAFGSDKGPRSTRPVLVVVVLPLAQCRDDVGDVLVHFLAAQASETHPRLLQLTQVQLHMASEPGSHRFLSRVSQR